MVTSAILQIDDSIRSNVISFQNPYFLLHSIPSAGWSYKLEFNLFDRLVALRSFSNFCWLSFLARTIAIFYGFSWDRLLLEICFYAKTFAYICFCSLLKTDISYLLLFTLDPFSVYKSIWLVIWGFSFLLCHCSLAVILKRFPLLNLSHCSLTIL